MPVRMTLVGVLTGALLLSGAARAQDPAAPPPAAGAGAHDGRGVEIVKFLGGAAVGLGAHESGHILAGAVMGADLGVKKVDFHGIPFFAITHSAVPPRREYVIASAGFWVQNATNEWLLSRHPDLRRRKAPFTQGVFAFNVLASAAYSAAAIARTGPPERDTRAMAASRRVSERWVGVLILAPAVLDAYRYFRPHTAWAAWASRGVKVGMVLLVIR